MQQVKNIVSIVSNTDYVFKYGKHKGHVLENVIVDDPGYIIWLDDKGMVKFSDEIYNQAELNKGS